MEIIPHYESGTGTWTYLVADEPSRRAAIIDPVLIFDPVSGLYDTSFIDQLLEQAQKKSYEIDWVIETHVHADHLSAAQYICTKTGAQLAAGQGVLLVQQNFVKVFNLKDVACDGSQFDRLLQEGDELALGQLSIRVLETPGHTPDGISLLVEDAAFVGDTLFAPELGSARCDFPGGNAASLFESVQKLHSLPVKTRLFLCHDYPADGEQSISHVSVQDSIDQNIHFRAEISMADFVAMRQKRDAGLSLPRLILHSVQFNIRGKQELSTEDNGVAYLKTPFGKTIKEILG